MPLKIDRLTVRSDSRGVVFEPLEMEMIAAQRNIHVVNTCVHDPQNPDTVQDILMEW